MNPALTSQAPGRVSRFVLPLTMIVAVFNLYVCTLSKHFSEGEDGSAYVIGVTSPSSAGELFHPNHLAFNAFNRVIFLLCRQAGYRGNACLPMQLVNVLAASLTLALMVRLLRRLKVDDRLTYCWVAVTAVCYGFWSYSTQPETYILPLPPILMCIDLVVGLADDGFSYKTFAWLGCFGAIATLFHQQHVLVLSATAISTAIIAYRFRSDVPMRRVAIGLGVFGIVAAAIVGTAYLTVAIGILHLREPEAIIGWAKGHAANGMWTPWSNTAPIQSLLVGFPRAVIGGHFMYGFDSFYNPVARRFPTKLLIEERYLAQQLPEWIRLVCAASAIMALAAGLLIVRSLMFPVKAEPPPREDKRRSQAANTIVLLLALHYYIFNTLWEPYNIEFWIVLLPVAAIAVALHQARRPRATEWWFVAAVLAASLGVANGLGSILPQARHETDFWYQANSYLIRNAKSDDIIITDGSYISNMYLTLFTGADVISARANAGKRLPQILLDQGSRRVWISSWAVEPLREVRMTGLLKATDEKALQRSFEAVHERMVKRDDGPYQTIWELLPVAR